MVSTTPTVLWNDSCSQAELKYAIEHGAVGATANPVIVGTVLRQEMHLWKDRLYTLVKEMPTATEDDIAWKITEEISVAGAKLLLPAFEASGGRNGRLSMQTDPRFYRNTAAIVEQAVHFAGLAPNIIVKIPVTKAGIPAIEEATYRGVSINATVSFTVPQAIAVAEAVERGLRRREAEGKDIASMGPVCTIMVGRLDDWLKVVVDKENLIVDPECLEWAGVAAMKRAYRIYRERGYRLRLLSAAFRNHLHWSQFIGGDMVISPPHRWQVRFNASDIEVVPRIDDPVPPALLAQLNKLAEFRKAYEPDGMTVDEFDNYGATRRTLRSFIAGLRELTALVRDFMLPDPDK
ncbi:MAG: transaldolase [Chloroflexi bacterium]|nr:transaldolase [Chloroflexota bacterium]